MTARYNLRNVINDQPDLVPEELAVPQALVRVFRFAGRVG